MGTRRKIWAGEWLIHLSITFKWKFFFFLLAAEPGGSSWNLHAKISSSIWANSHFPKFFVTLLEWP